VGAAFAVEDREPPLVPLGQRPAVTQNLNGVGAVVLDLLRGGRAAATGLEELPPVTLADQHPCHG
jgi:hypothetical protein